MAVLAPVLERKVNTEENLSAVESRDINMTADELHNSCIKENYARLINPDATVNDVIHKEAPVQQVAAPVVREQKPFLVENARADADIFRADSMINQKRAEANSAQSEDEEEENEDLRPTPTTIQYKTAAVSKIVDDRISNKKAKTTKLTKRDIIIMAVALLVIVALFVLVIVNSAVLSDLNSEVSNLQSDLAVAKENYAEVLEAKQAYFEEQNIMQLVSDYATKMGMSKI